jgi:hypothetical protein
MNLETSNVLITRPPRPPRELPPRLPNELLPPVERPPEKPPRDDEDELGRDELLERGLKRDEGERCPPSLELELLLKGRRAWPADGRLGRPLVLGIIIFY